MMRQEIASIESQDARLGSTPVVPVRWRAFLTYVARTVVYPRYMSCFDFSYKKGASRGGSFMELGFVPPEGAAHKSRAGLIGTSRAPALVAQE